MSIEKGTPFTPLLRERGENRQKKKGRGGRLPLLCVWVCLLIHWGERRVFRPEGLRRGTEGKNRSINLQKGKLSISKLGDQGGGEENGVHRVLIPERRGGERQSNQQSLNHKNLLSRGKAHFGLAPRLEKKNGCFNSLKLLRLKTIPSHHCG